MTETIQERITSYHVSYYGGGDRTARPYEYRAIVGLWGEKGHIGALYFHADPDTLPSQDYLSGPGHPMVHFPYECFAGVLDLLRNEDPVYYNQLSNWPEMAGIRTSLEPVGEGETA